MLLKSLGYQVDGYNWIPIVSYSFGILALSLGIVSLSFAVTAEVLPEHLRETGVSICNTIFGLSAFIVLKCVPLICDLIGFHGAILLFSGFCIPSLFIIIFYIPETKGKSYEEIMKSLQ